MKKLAIFILSALLAVMTLGVAATPATAGDGESNDMLLDVNQAP